jgi:two-component system OmpR family response regulator
LVVEDDAALRDVLLRALEESGHIVDTAADGPSAELMGADDSYDAIVLDVTASPSSARYAPWVCAPRC